MRHARAEDLDRLEPLLERLRKLNGLKEKSRGAFYRGSRAFLHFHEDDGAFYADVRLREDFERLAATSAAEQKALLRAVTTALGNPK
jgi:N-acetylglutamate synthase-like GNAT family acetyltransferase